MKCPFCGATLPTVKAGTSPMVRKLSQATLEAHSRPHARIVVNGLESPDDISTLGRWVRRGLTKVWEPA